MSDFTKAIENIKRIVEENVTPIVNETKKFVENFDFDSALEGIVDRSNAIIDASKKWVDDFNQFISDIQEKVKSYDFSISYDKDTDDEPVVEINSNKIKVTVKSKDKTSVHSIERTFPIVIDNEHVVKTYDADAKKLNFTVGIGEPTLKEEKKREEGKVVEKVHQKPRKHGGHCGNGCKHHVENDEKAEKVVKAKERIFGRQS